MKTRLGKIAQLPKSIRDDLNHRLENGKQGPELLEWLNGLPEITELLTQKFDNQPITSSNLSDWRHGGYQEWRADQLREARIQRICETGATLEKAETGDLFENFARITVAEMMADLDALQKFRGEKRSQHLHNLVRDLARLQNSYNRSRWAALAWGKYNDTRPRSYQTPDPTPSPTTPIVPDRAESQAGAPDDTELKPGTSGMYVLHFTNCDCNDPCPKCHGPASEYPLEDALRDRRYYRKYGRSPCDRHGKPRSLINVACDCHCDRCADKINSPTSAPEPARYMLPRDPEPGRVALPRDPIIHHERSASDESHSANPSETITSAPAHAFPRPLDPRPSPLVPPISPIPYDSVAESLRRISLLKTVSQ